MSSGVLGLSDDPSSEAPDELPDRLRDAPSGSLHLYAVETLRSAPAADAPRVAPESSDTSGPRLFERPEPDTVEVPEALQTVADRYREAEDPDPRTVFDSDARSTAALASLVGPNREVNTRVDRATRLLVRADRTIARDAVQTARQTVPDATTGNGRLVAEEHLRRADAALARAERLRGARDGSFDADVVTRRAAAIRAYRTAWQESRAAVAVAAESQEPTVTFSTRADPARTNISGEIQRTITGNVSGVRPSSISGVEVVLNDRRRVDAALDRGSGPLANTSFNATMNRSTRAATFDVVVTTTVATGGSGDATLADYELSDDGEVYVVSAANRTEIQLRDGSAGATLRADTSELVSTPAFGLTRLDVRATRAFDALDVAVLSPTTTLSSQPPVPDTRVIQYLPVTTTGNDSVVGGATARFRVAPDALPAGASPTDVVAYRYDGSGWTRVETAYAGNGQYTAELRSVSTLAVGVPRASAPPETSTPSAVGSPDTPAAPTPAGGSTPAPTATAQREVDRPDPDGGVVDSIRELLAPLREVLDSIFGSVSPVQTATAADRAPLGSVSPDPAPPQVNATETVVATGTVRFDADGLPDRFERETTLTDPLDPNSDSARTPQDDSETAALDGLEDFDDDGLQTNREGAVSTDPFASDTDGDGLPDVVEVVFDQFSPTDADTDGDGVGDAAEDLDGDGLTTAEEIDAGTAIASADTDGDGLPDEAEVTGPTNATEPDTDGDGLSDRQETREFPTDPTDPDTDDDGTLDANETFTTTASAPETGVAIDVTGRGDVADGVEIENRTDDVRSPVVEDALAGPIVELTSERAFESAEITLRYNASATTNESALRIFRFNESLRTFVPVDSTVNTTGDTVSATVGSFSTYTVFDERTWREYLTAQTEYEPLGSDATADLPDAPGTFARVLSVDPSEYRTVSVFATVDTPAGRNGTLDAESFRVFENGTRQPVSSVEFTEGTTADIAFVFDDSGSMGGEIRGLKRNVRSFAQNVEATGIDARYALVSFKDGNEVDQRFTSDIGAFQRSVDRLRPRGGGDFPEDSLDAINTSANLDFRDGAQKVVFHITDADSHRRGRTSTTVDELERRFRQSGTTFFTVSPGFGTPKTVELADRVGGTAENIRSANFDIFLTQLQETLTSRYQVTYESPRATDGTGRRVDLFVTDDGTTANATGAYIAPEGDLPAIDGADSDGDGLSDRRELGGIKTGSEGIVKTDPFDPDTDGDGVPDGEEVGTAFNTSSPVVPRALTDFAPNQTVYVLDSHPLQTDSDGDGLTDREETRGYEVRFAPNETAAAAETELSTQGDTTVRSVSDLLETREVSSNPLDSNSDGDDLPDDVERAIGTDPTDRDTDGDGISDDVERKSSNNQDPTLFEQTAPTVTVERVRIQTIEDRSGFGDITDDNDFRFHVDIVVRDLAGVERVEITKGSGTFEREFSGEPTVSFTASEEFEGGDTLGNLVDQVNPIDFRTLSIDAVDDFKNFVGAIADLAIGDRVFVRAVDVNGFVEEGFRRGSGAIDALVGLFTEFSHKLPIVGDQVAFAVGAVVGFANGLRGLLQGLWKLVVTGSDLLLSGAEAGFNFLTKFAADPIGFVAGAITDAITGAVGALNALSELITLSIDFYDVLAVIADLITGLAGGVLGAASAFFQVDAQQFNNPFDPLPGASNILEYGAENLGEGLVTFTSFLSPAAGLIFDINRNASFAGGYYGGIILFGIFGGAFLAKLGSLAASAISSLGPRIARVVSEIGSALSRIPTEVTVPRVGATAGPDNVVDAQTLILGFIEGATGGGVGPGPSLRATSLAVGSSRIPAARDPAVRDLFARADDRVVRDLRLFGRDLGGQFAAAQVIPFLSRHDEPGVTLLNALDRASMETAVTDTDQAFDSAVARARADDEITDDEADQLLTTYRRLRESETTDVESPRGIVGGDRSDAVYYELLVGNTGTAGARFATAFESAAAFREVSSTVSRPELEQFVRRTDGNRSAAAFVSVLANPLTEPDARTFFGYSGPREHLVRARLGTAVAAGELTPARAVETVRALESFSGERLTNATKNVSEAGDPARVATVADGIVNDSDVSPAVTPVDPTTAATERSAGRVPAGASGGDESPAAPPRPVAARAPLTRTDMMIRS